MQLSNDIPTLGGLQEPPPPSRREALQADGAAALREIDAVLARARRRATAFAVLRLGAVLLAGLTTALLAGALLASVNGTTLARLLTLALALLAVAAALVFSWKSALQRTAFRARDPRQVARLLGGPSELLSSVELAQDPPQGASVDLLALLHRRAADQARAIDLGRTIPARSLRWPFAALLGGGLLFAAATFVSARHVQTGLARLWKGDAGAPPPELSPIAGDLAVTYLYPAYTGLPPRTEEGTAGDLHAPRGTEVRLAARADRDVEQAFAVVNGAAVKLQADGKGRRQLSGTFQLTQPGSWSLRFADARGRTAAQGPSRPIEIVQDQPPQATLDAPTQRTLEVDPRGKVVIGWSATDDYGLQKIELVFQQAGAKEQRLVLDAPTAPAKRLRGSFGWELSPLHLRAGDKVSYHVEARDNDAVDGPQRGISATQVIKVYSAAEHSRESLVRAQALWERLVALLADRLEEKPAPKTDVIAWYTQTAERDRQAQKLSLDLDVAGRELSRDKLLPKALGRALRYAAQSLGPTLQRTSIARAPLSRGSAGREGALRIFDQALRNEIREEEKDVLYLEDLLDRARLDAMQELGKELAASRRELARLAEKLRKAPDEETRKELLSEVERLRERIQDLMSRMSELAKGIQDEHLNQEAVSAVEKEQDLLGQLTDIQNKLQKGNIEEALKQLDKLGQELDKLEQNLNAKAGQTQAGKYQEEAKQLREAARALKELKQKEQDLEKRTAGLRRELRKDAEKRFEQKGGKRLAQSLKEKAAQARKALKEIDPKVAEHLGLEDTLDLAQGRAADLERALEVGDFDEALDLAERAQRAAETLQGRLSMEDQVAQRYPGFSRDPAGVRKGLKGAGDAVPPLRDVVAQLQDALPREGQQGLSSEQMQRLRQQAVEQSKLRDELGKVRDQLGEVGKKVPVFGPQHEQMLEQAQQGMGQAEQRLGRGEPRGAQAGEQLALEKLQQFENAMEQLAKQSSGGPGGQGLPMPWGEPQGDGDGNEDGDGDSVKHDRVEIPDAESSRAPAEFRKELLDAMKQAPPEKYKERVKQYYEELVK